jgi:hypothetical protein
MRPLSVITGLLLALIAPFGMAAAAAAASAKPAPASSSPALLAPGMVEVTFDQSRVATTLGDRFTLLSRIVNTGAAPTDRLIAHLNVASLTGDVYVDPEDWSSSRSHDVATLDPGRRTSISWDIQAVNAGSFDVYVVLLPNGASSAGTGPLVVSPPVHVSVAGRQTLTAGGALPVVIVIPVLIGLAAATAWYRRRAA